MKQFDFNQVGKRMPYSVPDGFFDKFEENVMQDVKAGTARPKSHKMARTIKMAVSSAIAVAAAVALFFVVHTSLPKSEPVLASADDFSCVELAFAQLSSDDQDFLIAVYEDEEYISDMTITEDDE